MKCLIVIRPASSVNRNYKSAHASCTDDWHTCEQVSGLNLAPYGFHAFHSVPSLRSFHLFFMVFMIFSVVMVVMVFMVFTVFMVFMVSWF